MAAMTKAELATENDALRKSLSREVAKRKVLERRCATLSEARSEAREQQVATGEILRVISQSPTDTRPVFDTIVRNARRLCEADSCSVFTYGDELIHLESIDNATVEGADAIRRAYPLPPNRGHASGRAILTGRPVHIPDVRDDPEYDLHGILGAGLRSILAVPMLRDGLAIGTITLHTWATPRPFTDAQIELLKTFADQAVIAIENVRLFNELKEKNGALAEALEQQTATAEILRVISSSPTDVQPTFEAIARSARRLCEAAHGMVFRFDGVLIHLTAHDNLDPEQLEAVRSVFPIRPGHESVTARAILTRSLVHVRDRSEDPELDYGILSANFPTTLSVPLLLDGDSLGAITVTRAEVRLFSDKQVELLKIFADQAVIAIENVRLFTELQEKNRALTEAHGQVTEALEQQTATSEILRVISSSPTDVQPVFDTIAASGLSLCGALWSAVLRFDGEMIILAALHNLSDPAGSEAVRQAFPRRPSRRGATDRAILTRAIAYVPDVREDPEYQLQGLAQAAGYRSHLSVPMLRDGQPVGAITLAGASPGAFSERQAHLLQTFADQAVIAIENVRLFKELEARNRDLTEALDRQTATAEILRVISRSQTDVQPVFDTIADNAVSLFRPWSVAVYRFDGEFVHVSAVRGGLPGSEEYLRGQGPRRPTRNFMAGRCIIECSVVHIPDFEIASDVPVAAREIALRRGFKATLTVPMLKEGQPIGVISVSRSEAGAFSRAEIDLLQTFADQAVIAIENVRLFKELQARTGELTRSVEKLTALGEVSQVLSSTLDLDTVLTTIVNRAVHLSGADGGQIFEYDEVAEEFQPRASNEVEDVVAATQHTRLRKGEGAVGRMAVTREAIQIPDIAIEGAYESRARAALLRSGRHALLAVPLLSEENIVGGLVISRNAAGAFPVEVVDLLRTFATQSALAIQNARLFHEIENKSRQLEAASRHKSEFLANMSHELRTPLNAIIGFSEVLMQRMFGELNAKQDEYLKDIYESGRHLLSLINDILDLSKIEAGRMELELTAFDLPTAIDSALTLVRERATRRGIALRKTLDERVGQVQADERKIRQVILNLLSNAIKFTPEGGGIEVRAVPVDGSVEISVTDSGVGIAPEDHEAVFEEFRQVGASAAKQEGTGLGLALCRKFVELHGGTIWVTSAVGAGSIFTFRLPVRP